MATPTPAPVEPVDELLELAAALFDVPRDRVRFDVGRFATEVATLTGAQPPERRLALVAQRTVSASLKPGTLLSEELRVDVRTSVAAALLSRAVEQLRAHDDAVAAAQRALDEATRSRDRVAARRDRLAEIRDEGVARVRAAREG